MSMNVRDVLKKTDWPLLQKQKIELLYLSQYGNTGLIVDGLINFIDAIQDAAMDEGITTEAIMFGEST